MKELPEKLARWQMRSPWTAAVASFLLAVAALPVIIGVPGWIDGLSLNSDFTAMLPRTAQSVRDMDVIQARFGGQQALIVTIEAGDIDAVHRFTRDLAPRITAMRDRKVVAVQWNLSAYAEFVEEHGYLYVDLEDLVALRDALSARLDYERARANPFYIDLDDDPPPDPRETIDRIRADADQTHADLEARFPDGYFQHPERSLVLLVVLTTIRGGASGDTDALVDAIRAAVTELGPESYASDLDVRYGGTLMEVREETASLVAAVRNATILTVALVMIAIWIFFLRVRPVPLLSLALVPPVLLTFGFAELTVDYLNASSAFLSAIVVGNGINPNVIWLARYFEARRDGQDTYEALVTSHRETWKGTLTASLAAGVAYGSLITTDYRGFRDFGIVGGMGMILCWVAAYALLPSLTVLFERWRPLKFVRTKTHKGFYGVLFAKLAVGRPRTVLVASVLATVVSAVLVTWAVVEDPLEHDLRRLRSEREPGSDVEFVTLASSAILDDTTSGSGLAVLAPSRADALAYIDFLEANRDRFPNAYGAVTSLEDLLPAGQEEKLPVVRELRRLMLEVRPHVDAELVALIDDHLPPESPELLEPDDLPSDVTRPFTERDGTRGRLIVVEHHPDESGWDGLYTQRWAGAARTLRSPGATGPPPVAGTAVVMSDVMKQIWDDGPRAISVAFLATALLLAVTFRRHKNRWLTLVSLLVGILWMAGTMAAFGMRLNFLNFIAFPITFGNGADYAVNVVQRFVEEEKKKGGNAIEAVRAAVEGTGGAVVLCSLTTVIGYFSVHTSSNQALNSFGAAMAISEVTCLLAAVLALPAAICVLSKRQDRQVGNPAQPGDARPSNV